MGQHLGARPAILLVPSAMETARSSTLICSVQRHNACAHMSVVHLKNVVGWGSREFVSVCQLQTMAVIRENITLPALWRHASMGWLQTDRESQAASEICNRLCVRPHSVET